MIYCKYGQFITYKSSEKPQADYPMKSESNTLIFNGGQIIGMRHVLVHGYFDVDLDIVWNAIDDNLPILKKQIEAILHKIDHSGS